MDFLSQKPCLSTDEETKGFDLSAGSSYIYPKNLPIREYQFSIVKTALFNNTLVCLPTGLGKTFIAAVVMYNFWRWYPRGIIVFLAPTKPLVTQQVNACNEIMGIPLSETTELTGFITPKNREVIWKTRRVLFATPQTFQKDLERGIIPTKLIKCVVIDEAHKALGKHAYSECIRVLNETTKFYRILALSATPGAKIDAVQEVIRNLNITHLELRDDMSPDILPYINQRKIEIIQVGHGDSINEYLNRYKEIMEPHFRILLKNNIIRGNVAGFTKGRMFYIHKDLMNNNKHRFHGILMKTANILLTMCHAKDLLQSHGLRAFYNFYQTHHDKPWLADERELLEMLEDIKNYLGPFPDASTEITDDVIANLPSNIIFGHQKLYKLREILVKHFQDAERNKIDTRAIIFVEFCDIVNEILILLLQSKPLIKPQMFVGQAKLKQKDQKIALENFRNNKVNVLISTSVGEEGLDVGEVDLIICFDVAQQSTTRLIQRMGRTGRKRDGHIIFLVSDGKEHQTLKAALSKRDSMNKKVLHSSGVIDALNNTSPRMVPDDLDPQCMKMIITVIPVTPNAGKKLKAADVKKTRAAKGSKKPLFSESKPSTSKKKAQSTMLAFLQSDGNKSMDMFDLNRSDDYRMEVVPSALTPSQSKPNKNPVIKPSDIKILSSNEESIEFLTLCTMKMSMKDLNKDSEQQLPMTYSPTINFVQENLLDDFQVPSLDILNCISSLTPFVPADWDDSNDFTINKTVNEFQDFYNDNFLDNQFENPKSQSSVEVDSNFVDFFDKISSDSDASVDDNAMQQDNSPPHEDVDWGVDVFNHPDVQITAENTFEKLMDEFSDDTIISISDTTPEKEYQKPNVIEILSSDEKENRRNNLIDENVSSPDHIPDKIGDMQKKESNLKLSSDFDINAAFESDFNCSDVENNSCTPPDILVNQQLPTAILTSKNQTPKAIKSNVYSQGSPDLSRSRRSRNYKSQFTPRNLENKFKEAGVHRQTDDIIFIEEERAGDSLKIDTEMLKNKSSFIEEGNSFKTSDTEMHNKPSTDFKNSPEDFQQTNINSPLLNRNLSNLNVDDIDWGSDFEFSATPVTESKFFPNCKASNNETINESVAGRGPKENGFNDITNRNSFSEKSSSNCKSNGVKGEFKLPKNPSFIARTKKKKTKEKRKQGNYFLDEEAGVSGDELVSSDSSEGEHDSDLEQFVSYTQDCADKTQVDMRALYLQSVRSPNLNRGKFLIKHTKTKTPPRETIYSQDVTNEPNNYLYDSFCVTNEEYSEENDVSILDVMERRLKKRKKKRKESGNKLKRRKVIVHSSSEDENELMRAQVAEQSMMLKNL